MKNFICLIFGHRWIRDSFYGFHVFDGYKYWYKCQRCKISRLKREIDKQK